MCATYDWNIVDTPFFVGSSKLCHRFSGVYFFLLGCAKQFTEFSFFLVVFFGCAKQFTPKPKTSTDYSQVINHNLKLSWAVNTKLMKIRARIADDFETCM